MVSALEIIDTAVKVGLGALISGVAAFLLEKGRREEVVARERMIRKNDLLERTAEQIEVFSHVVLRYWALMIELVRLRKQGGDFTEGRFEDVSKAKVDLFDAFKELTSAEAKLMLLGHINAQKLLRTYGDSVTIMRRSAYEGNMELKEEHMLKFRLEILKARENLFNELSSVYKA